MHETFSRTDNILATKQVSANLRKLKSNQASFSDHNAMRLEINYKKKNSKKKRTHKYVKTKQHATNQQESLKKFKKKSRTTWRQVKVQ